MSELKNCPICGGEARLRYLKPLGWVQCKKCGATSAAVSDYYEETDGRGQAVAAWNRRTQPENEPLTNADRIRGMSDEELARWLVDATVCERVRHEDEYCHGNECVKRVTVWLQQPAETEGAK